MSMLRRTLLGSTVAVLGLGGLAGAPPAVAAEVEEVRLAQQFGLPYLPLIVARNQKLFEKHLAAAGLPQTKVTWARLSGGAAINDALLSGSVDYVAGGLGPLLVLWDKTRGRLDVRGVAGLDASAGFLNTNNPAVRTLADFKETDRIALPAVKVSIQAVMLQMAAEQAFGVGNHTRLDNLTVTLPHPEGLVALLSGKSEVTAHFTSPPFNHQELAQPGITRVLNTYDLFGGPATVTTVYATGKFRTANPKTHGAVLAALREGHAFIAADPTAAARIYVEEEGGKVPLPQIEALLRDPTVGYSLVPKNTAKIADFLHRIGTIKNKPESWKDYFFPELHDQAGS